MINEMPNEDEVKKLTHFGTSLSMNLIEMFAENVIKFKNNNPELANFIPGTASLSVLVGIVGMISKTGVFDEKTVHEIVNDTFSSEFGKNESNNKTH